MYLYLYPITILFVYSSKYVKLGFTKGFKWDPHKIYIIVGWVKWICLAKQYQEFWYSACLSLRPRNNTLKYGRFFPKHLLFDILVFSVDRIAERPWSEIRIRSCATGEKGVAPTTGQDNPPITFSPPTPIPATLSTSLCLINNPALAVSALFVRYSPNIDFHTVRN